MSRKPAQMDAAESIITPRKIAAVCAIVWDY